MGRSVLWLPSYLILFLLQHHFIYSFSKNTPLCPNKQRLALFQFKKTFTIDTFASRGCDHYEGPTSYPKTNYWNTSSDCCTWDGVTCDELTGDVIALDLSCSQLVGVIHSNSSLFKLPHLQRLNLAFNNFSLTRQIPREFGRFASSLTHLNLSASRFSGLIPSEITHLYKLVSLDLCCNSLLKFEFDHQILERLFQNFTRLQELSLSQVSLNSVLPTNLSSSLTILDLDNTGLHGEIPQEIFHLPNLQSLVLAENLNLNGYLPRFQWKSNSTLRRLDLSCTGLSGEVPQSIGYLKSLYDLDLGCCNLVGSIPNSISNLTQLMILDMSANQLKGQIPDAFANLDDLRYVYLDGNQLNGPFASVASLKGLNYLYISHNSLTGPLPYNISGLQNLIELALDDNSLNGTIPSWLFGLPSLNYLYLQSNRLTGQLHEFKSKQLIYLDLSSNNLNGSLDIDMFSNLKNLERLHLSDNRLSIKSTGTKANFPNLSSLGLSSCKIEEFPYILSTMDNLRFLDLSNNQIHDEIPHALLSMRSLSYLNIYSNFLRGLLPSLICNLSSLEVLDLSHNNFVGEIPHCLGNFNNSMKNLKVLDLRMNHFDGHIPSIVANKNLRSLNLQGNRLEGTVPQSLSNCTSLQVLDLGNNLIRDTFPRWLESLPDLQVLVLRSNQFYGPIDDISMFKHPFAKLRIIDLSDNEFIGVLPSNYFKNFKEMMNGDESIITRQEYMGNQPDNYSPYYYDSVTVVTKGVEIELERILTVFTAIDLSDNKFEGEITMEIGNLTSLRILNVSHNNLIGHIPSMLGNVRLLESLDLSFNEIVGEIPEQLTALGFLAVLNLSHNHLAGHIPQGKQFNTFDINSYSDNLALCGKPLTKRCEDGQFVPHVFDEEEDDSDFTSGFTWKAVLMGYGCGTFLGFIIGYLMFLTGKPKWFTRIVGRDKVRRIEIRW